MGQQCAGVVRFAADSEAEAVTRRDDTMAAVVWVAIVRRLDALVAHAESR